MEIDNNVKIPTEEERQNILSQFNKDLKNIYTNKKKIFDITKVACDKYYKYKDFIFPDLLRSILSKAEITKKLKYLYLIIEIIKYFNSNKSNCPIKNDFLINIFLYVREICRCFFYSFNDDFIKTIKISLNELKKCNIYPSNYIDELLMELRMKTEPNITDSVDDRKCLCKLVNNNLLEIDHEMINLNKDFEELKRTNNNNLRINLIKKENKLIEKQIKLYNENLKQIKCLNELINISNNLIDNSNK